MKLSGSSTTFNISGAIWDLNMKLIYHNVAQNEFTFIHALNLNEHREKFTTTQVYIIYHYKNTRIKHQFTGIKMAWKFDKYKKNWSKISILMIKNIQILLNFWPFSQFFFFWKSVSEIKINNTQFEHYDWKAVDLFSNDFSIYNF